MTSSDALAMIAILEGKKAELEQGVAQALANLNATQGMLNGVIWTLAQIPREGLICEQPESRIEDPE